MANRMHNLRAPRLVKLRNYILIVFSLNLLTASCIINGRKQVEHFINTIFLSRKIINTDLKKFETRRVLDKSLSVMTVLTPTRVLRLI